MSSEPAASALKAGAHLICLTPTRNEAWIVRQFIAAARFWATEIVVADQGSTDGTLEALQAMLDVEVVINKSLDYNEEYRQRILLDRARTFSGRRILIGLDADEALSSNLLHSEQWARIYEAEPGTILRFRWANILPGFQKAWIPPEFVPFGFVDDGSEHNGRRIHSPRVPQPAKAPVLDIDDVVVLHFQYVLWERMQRKQRWYQAWEHIKHQQKSALQIFREYNHMYGGWQGDEIHPLPSEWLEGYERAGIDFRSLKCEPVTWWDREIVRMIQEYGPNRFRRIAVWDTDWNALAAEIGVKGVDLSDPRSIIERAAHRLLERTQNNRSQIWVRGFEKILRLTGW